MTRWVTFFLGVILLVSCNKSTSKYQSNWIVIDYQVDAICNMDDIGLYNFLINTSKMQVVPPSLFSNRIPRMQNHKIKIYSENRKKYMKILDHPIFEGTYNLECLDNNCCTLIVSNERIYFELLYNGNILTGWDRDCPRHD